MTDGRAGGVGASELGRRLQESLHNNDLAAGRRLTSLALVAGLHTLPSIAHLLIRILSSAAHTLLAAGSLLCSLPCPSPQAWHSILAGHARAGGSPSGTLELYSSMLCSGVAPSKYVLLLALKACSALPAALPEGRLVHTDVIHEGLEQDVYVASALVYMYGKSFALPEARALFDAIGGKTVVSWNAMLAVYIQSGDGRSAMELFAGMEHEPNQVTLSCITKACGMMTNIEAGKHVHQHALESGLTTNQHVASSLIDMYAKCGALDEAQYVFAGLKDRSAVSWNALVSGYVFHGQHQLAVDAFLKMQQQGVAANNSSISTVLQACGNLGMRDMGFILHAWILEVGITVDDITVGSLVDAYVNCAYLEDACSVLHIYGCLSKASWGAIFAGCAQQERGLLALELFEEMQWKSDVADDAIYACALKGASLMGALEEGKLIHDQILRHGMETNIVVGSALSDMYNKCGTFDDGLKVYECLSKQDLVSWSTMLAGYVQNDNYSLALGLFEKMKGHGVKPDSIMFSIVLNACGKLRALEQGKCLHHDILTSELQSDETLYIVLIEMYIKCGHLAEAVNLFESSPVKDALAWGAIIMGHVQHGSLPLAFNFLSRMQDSGIEADETILMSLLKTCSSLSELKFMHEKIRHNRFEFHTGIGNSLIDMYGKLDNLVDARKVFDGLLHKDVVTWNSMIAGYAEHGLIAPLLELYEKMEQQSVGPDAFTYSCILKACCRVREIDLGNLIFEQIVRRACETDVVVLRSAIEMYAKLGSLEDAVNIFEVVSSRSSSLRSIMIGAFGESDCIEFVTRFFDDMQKEGLKSDDGTCTSVLASMSRHGEKEQALYYLNLASEVSGVDPKHEHFNCAIDLLGRLGHTHEAGDLLQALPLRPDVIGSTSLLASWRSHGNSIESSKGSP